MTEQTETGDLQGAEDKNLAVEAETTLETAAGDDTEHQEGKDEAGEEQNDQSKEDRASWEKRRIDKLTAQKYERDARIRELEQKLAAQQPGNADEQIQALAEQRAREIAAAELARAQQAKQIETFNEASNSAFDAGSSQFTDFEDAITDLRRADGFSVQFVQDVIDVADTPADRARVLYELGKNPDEAERIMSLPEKARVKELTRLSLKPASPPPSVPVSKAPPPVNPVGGKKMNADDLNDDLPADEWIKRRNKQLYGR